MRHRELVRLVAAQMGLHGCMAGLRMATPLLALQQGHSAAAVGLLLAFFSLAQIFLAIPAGRYADRHGMRRPVAVAAVAATLGAGLAAAFPMFPVLCVAALLTGGATGIAIIALQRHVGRVAESPAQLRETFSFLAIGPSLSNFLGPMLAGLAIDHAGFPASFLLLALLPVLGWMCIRNLRDAAFAAPVKEPTRGQAWTLAREPQFRRLLIVNWLIATCWDVHTFVVPVIGHERDFSATTIGSILGAFAIAGALTRLLLPALARHLREWMVVGSAMVATAALLGVYPLLASPLAMGACSALLGVALGCVQPMMMSTLHQITPEHRHGEALGLRMITINAASVAMPLVFGAMGAVVSVAWLFWSVAATVGAGSQLAWLEARKR